MSYIRFSFFCLVFSYFSLNAQNVGIGVSSPDVKLHVAGKIRSDSLQNGDSALVLANSKGTLIYQSFPDDTSLFLRGDGKWKVIDTTSYWVKDSNYLYNTDDSIGIGIKKPQSKIHVSGEIRIDSLRNLDSSLVLANSSGVLKTKSFPKDSHQIFLGDGSWGERYWKRRDGHVYNSTDSIGIGVTSPDQKLEIKEISNRDKFALHSFTAQNSATTDYYNVGVLGQAFDEGTGRGVLYGVVGLSDTGVVHATHGVHGELGRVSEFSNVSDEDDTARAAIYGDANNSGHAGLFMEGFVGVNTNFPDTNLHVQGNIKMTDGNQAAGKVLTSDANGVGRWKTQNGGGSVMYIANGGSCPAGWTFFDANYVAGGSTNDACHHTSKSCQVMYIANGGSCPAGWTFFDANYVDGGSTNDACFLCN